MCFVSFLQSPFFFFFFLMIRRPPRSTHCISSAASDVYKRQVSTQSTWGNLEVQKLLVNYFVEKVNATNDEKSKFTFLKLMKGTCIALKNNKDALEIYELILNTVFSNLGIASNEEQYLGFSELIKSIFENIPDSFVYKSEEAALVTKRLKQQSYYSNKFQQALVCQIFYCYLKRFQKSRDSFKEVSTVLEQICQNVYLQNLKENKKLVTNSIMLLQSLVTITTGYAYLSESSKADFIKSFSTLLSHNNYINQEEFFIKNPIYEKSLLFTGYSQILKIFGEEVKKSTSQTIILSKVWMHAFVQSQMKVFLFKQEFSVDKCTPCIFDSFCLSLFSYAYFIYDKLPADKKFESNAVLYLIKFLVDSLPVLKDNLAQLNYLEWFFFLLYHPSFSTPKLQRQYTKKVRATKDLKQLLYNKLQKSKTNSGICMITKIFTKNPSQTIQLGGLSLARSLFELGLFEIIDDFQLFFIKENQDKLDSLCDLEAKIESCNEQFYDENLASILQVLDTIGLKNIQKLYEKALEEANIAEGKQGKILLQTQQQQLTQQQPHQNASNTQSQQKSEKVEFLDEQELLEKKKKDAQSQNAKVLSRMYEHHTTIKFFLRKSY
eukprot:TRINITY_DN1457_c0_g2_i2.p2 TRINITY_DN1457_c0_g2~~TRINITY_DN1457_c0_g2_i2.p2  ORF type:complete len:606 (-),score=134.07 TRINITY_DN1457_c0_g2_i2:1905-3722(-)